MIELTIPNYSSYQEGLLLMNNILQWLALTISSSEENHDIRINGTLCVFDDSKKRMACLIMCEGPSQKRIQELLKEPPNEYKEKYVACITSEEPEVVYEQKGEEAESDEEKEESIDAT